MLRAAHALLAMAALAPLCGSGCGGKSPAGNLPPAATATTQLSDAGVIVAGASGTVSTAGAGTGGMSAGAAGAPAGSSAAGGRSPVAGADAGLLDAGPPVCGVSDNIVLSDEDADGGIAPDCHDVPRTIIQENCIGYCHHNRGAPSGGLNLQSPCVADRLIDVVSQCEGLMFVDSKDPERSFLLDKLEHAMPRCGKSMPDGWHLPPNQVACMSAWVHAIVRAATHK